MATKQLTEEMVIERLTDDWVPPVGLPERLLLLRKSLGWTTPQIAGVCGYSPASWSAWERGGTPRDSMHVVQQIAARTKCDVEWLMFGESQNRKNLSDDARFVELGFTHLDFGGAVLMAGL